MRQEVHIVQIINFSTFELLYKGIKWFVLLSAPILWIGLISMAKKGRKILYWWYLSVSREAFKTSKQTLCCCMENKSMCSCCEFWAVLENHKHKYWQEKAKMNQVEKILCNKHMHPNIYDLSEFKPMPDGKYMLISTPKCTNWTGQPWSQSYHYQ